MTARPPAATIMSTVAPPRPDAPPVTRTVRPFRSTTRFYQPARGSSLRVEAKALDGKAIQRGLELFGWLDGELTRECRAAVSIVRSHDGSGVGKNDGSADRQSKAEALLAKRYE